MNMPMGQFLPRPMKSINLSIDFSGSITKCYNPDSLGLKLVWLWIFNDFSVFFIKFHEYARKTIYIIYHTIKGLCLTVQLRPDSVV